MPESLTSIAKWIVRILLILLALFAILVIAVAILFNTINKTNGEIISSGEVREYLLYIPESYDPDTPTPLMISMHGFIEWPAHQAQISEWNEVADEYGFIVVYPAGTGFPLRWRTYSGPGLGDGARQDVQFISDLIDKLAQDYNLDLSRVYANGLSNGGGMAYLLACELSERITAIGGVAGAYILPGELCEPTRPVPVIAFHGTDDRIVPYEGGGTSRYESQFPSIPDWVHMWAQRNGCDLTPVELPDSGEVSGIQYSGCDQGADVIFYTVHGGGHTWPGGEPLPEFIAGHTTQDINASREMWEFYSKYSLGN